MATVTAEDIRTVAERVRAAAEIVAPYERREPYDFEVFEPLMKMVPKERVPCDPPPRRPHETDREYHLAWRSHYNIWLLQKIDDYFKVKGGRLLSPSSDIDDDDDVRAQTALRNQEKVLRGMDIVDWEFLRRPMVHEEHEKFEIPPEFWERQRRETRDKEFPNDSSANVDVRRSRNNNMALSSFSGSPQGPRRHSSNIQRSIENSEEPAAEQLEIDGSAIRPSIEQPHERPQSGKEMESSRISSLPNPEPTRKRKQTSLPVEDGTVETSTKRQRTDKRPQLSTSPDTAGHKRKRDGEEPLDEPSSTGISKQPSDKKRRLDAQWKIQPPQKRKRGSQANGEESQGSRLGDEVPGSKRRRWNTVEVTNIEQSAQHAFTTVGSGRTLARASPLRITRARRRQLSGEDAQLLQLDQRGKPDVQEPKHSAPEPAQDRTLTSQNSRRLKAPASIDVNNSRRTKATRGIRRASTKVSTKDSTTTETTKVTTKATTSTMAKTISRSASSRTRGKDRPLFT
ncbi:uncharacterized protein TRIREDRAFT_121681 [Trichoderma reesei QM6a]|jgi:hypothetical protein|uniref:Predicted protein n=2 Tax=Hypocrea jecorina TaxID=51453 RepID=G0RIB1_HYPJQ|nr:uncharacterized protein TRIREDRAFT_121681 [Trichoderma reesei QM6a]EGR48999.1 predicted protein [Trichoderma reesei QM6a]ETS02376.1 hypothetical protein M419DRAFT_136933 [Trichoderma reesei RUT C-30]